MKTQRRLACVGTKQLGNCGDDLRGPCEQSCRYPTKRDNKPISEGNFCEDTGV
jgi:hypothetical protein